MKCLICCTRKIFTFFYCYRLPYTEAVITESQRLWPPFPIIGPRRCLRDTNLGGYKIPKDSTILLNMYSIHVDPEIYPDPHTFKPERFIKDGVYEPNASNFSFGKGTKRDAKNIFRCTSIRYYSLS